MADERLVKVLRALYSRAVSAHPKSEHDHELIDICARAADEIERLAQEVSSNALKLPSWVKAAERLPEPMADVLLYTDGGVVQGYHNGEGFHETYTCNGPACYGGVGAVTHWMPLPEAPK